MDFILSQNNLYIVLIAVVSGALLLWPSLGKRRGSNPVSATEAVQLANRQQGVFIDVRSPEQYKAGTIAQARNVPAAEIEAKLDTLPKNKPLIVFCDQGREAIRAAAALRKHGLEAVSLEGGLRAWSQAGLPLSKKA
ncbi:rhodanese-like domain-containing protein [Pusillimonas noertemannii]|uniref:Rhodanese-related sulfurtransferase n=1 Tax=Pusillimonas noertemannii TaxID=305977 RepID=A0A2U1CN83_9BURK|nr:rhodanese-related sulfurtransferase [Pusillimonas noertemannii]TFL10569.1 rhodanese-like domain-containing protein [Pusillimonas noertemannii]